MTARISLILEKARGHRTCEKIEVAEHLPAPSGRRQGEGLRIWIDFRLRAIALALRATFIPDPQRESFIGNEFSPRTMRTPNCWPSSSNANEKSSVLNEFSRKVNPTSVIHDQMSRKLISNDQFPIRNPHHDTGILSS